MTRILHSFPTRRSSDLSEVIPLLLFWGHLNSCPFLVTLRSSRQSRTRYRRMKQSIGKDFSRTLAQSQDFLLANRPHSRIVRAQNNEVRDRCAFDPGSVFNMFFLLWS